MSRVKQFINNILGRQQQQQSVILNKVTVRPIHRKSQDIQTWRNAIQSAEGYTQQRANLYDLFEEILLDGFLLRCIEKRISRVTNRDLTFTIDGKQVDEVVALTEQSFFGTLLREIMNARFWGHSLIEPVWPAPNSDTEAYTHLIPRKNVKPRYGIVTKEPWDLSGVDYNEPPYKGKVIEVGGVNDIGLLMQAAQYVIYKRGNFGDWAEFAEVFGMPFRWATYNDEASRLILEEALSKAGTAGYVVAPEDAQLQFLNQTSMTGTQIFKQLRDALNAEIAILILGNTMTTTEASSSGYAQSNTHQLGEDEINKDDRKYVVRVLNEKVTPYLESLGYKVKGGKWSFVEEETISLKDRLEIDIQVAGQVSVPDEYWYTKYKIPMPSAAELQQKKKTEPKE